MAVGIEALFTSALGLQAPWSVKTVELDTARRRIDFKLIWSGTQEPRVGTQRNPGSGTQGQVSILFG